MKPLVATFCFFEISLVFVTTKSLERHHESVMQLNSSFCFRYFKFYHLFNAHERRMDKRLLKLLRQVTLKQKPVLKHSEREVH